MKTTDNRRIKALIFDLGGVLIDLDIPRFRKTLKDLLSYTKVDDLVSGDCFKGAYCDLEEGKITPGEYRSLLLADSASSARPEDVDAAMYSLLSGLAPYKADLLRGLSREYPLYLLSNNNSISMKRCSGIFDEAGVPLSGLFRQMFISSEMKCLKPSREIFSRVVEAIGLPPENLLFVDDSRTNADAAEKFGMNVLHYIQGSDLKAALAKKLEELELC